MVLDGNNARRQLDCSHPGEQTLTATKDPPRGECQYRTESRQYRDGENHPEHDLRP